MSVVLPYYFFQALSRSYSIRLLKYLVAVVKPGRHLELETCKIITGLAIL